MNTYKITSRGLEWWIAADSAGLALANWVQSGNKLEELGSLQQRIPHPSGKRNKYAWAIIN